MGLFLTFTLIKILTMTGKYLKFQRINFQIIILASLIIALNHFSCTNKNAKDRGGLKSNDSTVIFVNKSKVDFEEYKLHLVAERAMTFNYFNRKYGVEQTPEFWTTKYGNERPIDYIKQRADEKLTNRKVIQTISEEHKVAPKFDYNEFLNYWKIYTHDRLKTKKAGGVVYGSVEVGKKQYYEYLFSNLEIRLRNKLNKTVFNVNEEKLQGHYQNIKNQYFKYSEELQVRYLMRSFSYSNRANIENEAKDIIEKLGKDQNMKQISKSSEWEFKSKTYFDSIPSDGEENPDAYIRNAAKDLKMGEYRITDVDYNIYIVTVEKPLERKIKAFEKVKGQVKDIYQAQKYDSLINHEVKSAVLLKNEKVYDTISMQ